MSEFFPGLPDRQIERLYRRCDVTNDRHLIRDARMIQASGIGARNDKFQEGREHEDKHPPHGPHRHRQDKKYRDPR